MQFETKLVNGKPSIYFANDSNKTPAFAKKINTKDKRAAKAIRDSLEISGEVDHVKPSPRNMKTTTEATQTAKSAPGGSKKTTAAAANNGVTLNPDQLMSLLSAIQSNGAQIKIDDNGRIKLLEDKMPTNRRATKKQSNSDDEDGRKGAAYYNNDDAGYDSDNITPRRAKKQGGGKRRVDRLRLDDDEDDYVTTIRKPTIVTAYDSDEERRTADARSKQHQQAQRVLAKDKENVGPALLGGGTSLMEKKRLQWQQDKQSLEKLQKQDAYDRQKDTGAPKFNDPRMSVIPRTGHTPEPPKQSLTLAEKKRLQWQKEKEESNNSYRSNKSRFRSYYDEFNLRSSREDPGVMSMQKSYSLNNLTQNAREDDPNNQILSKLNIDHQDQKLSLMERKKLKWANEVSDAADVWNPFGRPGAGAPNQNVQIEPPAAPKSYTSQKEELTRKQMELLADRTTSFHDQTKVPAAMRTSLLFGDVLFDDDVKRTKELERKKWLLELEQQKKEKIIEKEYNKEKEKLNDLKKDLEIKQDIHNAHEASDRSSKHRTKIQEPEPEPKSFQRSMNRLLDPSQLEDMERKRKANVQHQKEIQAQIQEKKRLLKLEDELQSLNNQKIENEAKQLNLVQQQETQKRKEHYFGGRQADNSAREDEEQKATEAAEENDSAQVSILQAEYNAALEKHKRLLTKLQKGGHDTEKLEAKFNEFRAKCRAMGVNVGNDPASKPPMNNKSRKDDHEMMIKPPARQQKPKQQQQHQEDQYNESDRRSRLKDESINTDESSMIKEFGTQTNQSQLKQIFNLLREDTNDLPIEMTEENVKALLKKVAKNPELLNNKNNSQKVNSDRQQQQQQQQQNDRDTRFTTRVIEKAKQETQSEIRKRRMPIAERPKWGYKNLEKKKSVPNSQKDPFFKERQAIAEERRKLQLEQLKALIEMSNQRSTQRTQQRNYDDDNDDDEDIYGKQKASSRMTRQPPSRQQQSSNDRHSRQSSQQQQQESIMNLLNNHNLRNKVIYEEEDDDADEGYNNNNRNRGGGGKTNTQRRLKTQSRQHEDSDPAHATSPIPPSRESTATRRDREKARQAYHQNMKPSDYGSTSDNYHENQLDVDYRNKMKDPLFNQNLVKGRPTPRQEHILSQLANLKQSLIQKQKEVASSIRYDDEDD